jgi:cyclic AMP-responsive element-binding protein 3
VALIDARIKHFMRSQQVCLTEEEKETLKAEGLPIPTTLPFTKVEEKALKSVRRKIRNKVAAQESRKRKKEHMEELEDKVRLCTSENLRLQKKVESLESENRSLMAQLKRFQALVAGTGTSRHTTKVGACLMVIVLCFAVFLGGWAPQKHAYWASFSSDYATTSVRSRSLLSLDTADTTFPQAVCDWFRYAFFPDKHIHNQHTESSPDHKPGPVHTWPDIYLSSYTPLTVHTHNDSHSRAAVAA